ncbi:MAG: hypothetical protein COB98_04840 [Flavobacteriaceae bacterium]|nr:MAG: hypothetical protein COB98_04840 [Flavobacteriaceae bacterium]
MKKTTLIIITVLLLFGSGHTYGQSKIYFDAGWELTSKDNAHYYRLIDKINDSLFNVKDFYINNVLQMEGHFTDLEKEVFEGLICWYKKDGKISSSETYTNGVLHGISTVYLKNGKIEHTCEYKNGKVYEGLYVGATAKYFYKKGKIVKKIEFDPPNDNYILSTEIYGETIDSVYWRTNTGKKIGVGIYRDDEIYEGLEVLNLLSNTLFTHYKNGKKDGIQKVFDTGGKLISEKTFVRDTLMLDKTWHPITGEILECIYKNDRGFQGRFIDYNPIYEYYREFIFEKGKLITKNRYRKVEGALLLIKTTSF